jgi:streptogramin lyase
MHHQKRILQVVIPIAISLTLLMPFVNGQNYSVTNYTTKDGLAHNNIRAITSDSSGFLWIGTWDGLSRFDGYEFKNYFHIPGDSTSLPYFSVNELVVDGANNLWIFTDKKQLAIYNRANESFRILKNIGNCSLNNIESIALDKNKNLLVIAKDRLLIKDLITDCYEAIHFVIEVGEKFTSDEGHYDYSFESDSILWVYGRQISKFKIEHLKENRKQLRFDKNYSIDGSFFNRHIDFDFSFWFSVFKSTSGNVWLFSNIGLFRLDERKNTFTEFNGNIPTQEFTGKKLFFWGTNSYGLYLYKPQNKTLIHVSEQESHMAKKIINQSDELIWFCNTSSLGTPIGFSKLILTPSFFRNYPLDEKGNDMPAIFCIVKDSNNVIWTAVRGRDYITKILPGNIVKKEIIIPPKQTEIAGHLRTILKVPGGLWLGYYLETLIFYDFHKGKYVRNYPDTRFLYSLAADSSGKIYIGGQNLSVYNPATRKTQIIWNYNQKTDIYKLVFGRKNILWGGMNYCNLLNYNILTGENLVYNISPENYNIEDILEDQNGNLWLTLLGGGICMFNPVSGSKKFYTTASGLSNNTTYSLLMDKQGKIWISTDFGLSCFNPRTEQFQNYNKTDGLGINEFNSDASTISSDGEFLFGGMGGIVGFYPDSINKLDIATPEQKVIITEVKVSGEIKLFQKPVYEIDTIILNKGENNINISFSSSDFINSVKTKYRYYLASISDKWIETDSRNRNINYSNLNPGWYNLIIEATNRKGEWLTSKSVHIRISPYFYQSKLFLITAPLLILAFLAAIIYIYIRQIKQRERQKQDSLRLQSLRGQMNPHFIFNSLNSINYFISNNDRLSANRYIADFARLIRSILSNMGNEYVPFENEVNSIKDYLNIEHLRFGDKFDFEIISDETEEPLEVFPGLIQPFVENAIWHGVRGLENRKGIIRIKFTSSEKDKIKCFIEDDGIGRRISSEKNVNGNNHTSKAIGIVQERLQIIGKLRRNSYNLIITDLYFDRPETGTIVEIDIPCKHIQIKKK